MSFIFGGGDAAPQQTGSSVVTQREAPGVEARKLSLYDQAAKLAASPVDLPAIQVAGLSPAEQQAIAASRQGGTGTATVGSGIATLQQGISAPNIQQFFNPFQSFVTDEITRQANIATNSLGAQAAMSGAFGGGRQGIAEAEIERARLANIGQAQAQGFQTALGAAQTQRQQQLAAGQALAGIGAQQQAMGLADIQAQLRAGALQRGIGQAQLDAQRQTQLQRQFEPFQRIEFLKGIMTNLPTTQSTITASTAPGGNPFGQALGAGLGAYSAYNLMQPR